jgi:hypothetical protein
VRPALSRAAVYELEDLIAEMDAADVVAPSRALMAPRWRRPLGRALGRASLGAMRLPEPAPRVEGRYDVLYVHVQDIADLLSLGDLGALHKACAVSVCNIDEIWSWNLHRRSGELDRLRRFDHVFVGCHGTVRALADHIGRPCWFLPAAADALLLSSSAPERVIDVWAMGRRSPTTHRALQELARERGLFYLYDTAAGNRAIDPREHRRLTYELLRRTKAFLVYRAKVDAPRDTGGQEEVGFRFFEGVASGALLLGEAPATPSYPELFPWPDALVSLPFGSTDVAPLFDELARHPERVAAQRRRNVAESLVRHDWAHRWSTIVRTLGLAPHARTTERLARLERRAAELSGAAEAAA